jgi:hypothetical protein
MAVTKADILTFTNAKLRLDDKVADILDEINAVLDDLSRAAKWPDLYRANVTADQSSISSGDTEIALPTGLRVLDYIVINDGDNDGRPLSRKINDRVFTFAEWLRRQEDAGSTGEPVRFARRGKNWYPDPIPDDAYTAKYWFWRYHPKITADDDILFGDEFDVVIKYGVCAEVAKTHRMSQNIALWEPRYMAEKAKMLPEEDRDTTLAKYHDL